VPSAGECSACVMLSCMSLRHKTTTSFSHCQALSGVWRRPRLHRQGPLPLKHVVLPVLHDRCRIPAALRCPNGHHHRCRPGQRLTCIGAQTKWGVVVLSEGEMDA
jgi:hypothetical protein